MQILPIRQFNQNNNQRVQKPSFQALRPQYLKGCSGKIVDVPWILKHTLEWNPEVQKAVKYFERIGKDITYNANCFRTEEKCFIDFTTIDPKKSQHEIESILGEYSHPTTTLNMDTKEFSFKADNFIKGYENFVELENKNGLIGNIIQAIQSANAKSEPAQGIANLNKANYQRKTAGFSEHLK